MRKILVALSGGVDSAVSAFLLKKQGYDVSGAYIKSWLNEDNNPVFANCPWQQDIDDARAVANLLGIDFKIINLIDEYKKHVVDYLVEGYKNGTTPNPDVMCNREMKFGFFLEYALSQGFDGIATGHYCRKIFDDSKNAYFIKEGLDKNKDQSYFLALLNQHQIKHTLFPIGEYTKPQVRVIADENQFPNSKKKDSQGICFLGKISINDFLKEYIPNKPGNIVNIEGKHLGTHQGLHRYTLGQRKGIGIPSNSDFNHYIVVAKDFEKSELVVAFESERPPGLFTSEVTLRNLHFSDTPIVDSEMLLAKPRYRDPSQVIKYIPGGNNLATIQFETPQRALAKGQLLAIYNDDILLGGGFYC